MTARQLQANAFARGGGSAAWGNGTAVRNHSPGSPADAIASPQFAVARSSLSLTVLIVAVLVGCSPPCKTDAQCGANRICRDGACREPQLPRPSALALVPVVTTSTETNVLVSGRAIAPAGTPVSVGTFPTRFALSPNGAILAVNENGFGTVVDPRDHRNRWEYLRILDGQTLALRQTIAMPGRSMNVGLAFNADGSRLYAAGGQDGRIYEFAVAPTGGVALLGGTRINGCYTADLVVTRDGRTLFVSCLLNDKVVRIDWAAQAVVEVGAGTRPYRLALSSDERTLFVANWNSSEFRPAGGDTVTAIDVAAPAMSIARTLHVGLGPEGIVVAGRSGKVYVVCNKSDDVWTIDQSTLDVGERYPLDPGGGLEGIYPVALTIAPDESRLYVAGAQENEIVVLALPGGRVLGNIPAAWYPSDTLVSADGKTLFVLSAKGNGDGPTEYRGAGISSDNRDQSNRALKGSVFTIPVPDATVLARYSQTTSAATHRQDRYFRLAAGNDSALPSPGRAGHSPIEYVFLILKENFSFDVAYGDLGSGDGDPQYAVWGGNIIPNQRALARQFALLDNFYCDSGGSIDGHQWAVAAIVPDWTEKGWLLDYGDYGFDDKMVVASLDPGTITQSLFFLPHLIRGGLKVMGYGGIENYGLEAASKYADSYLAAYPWNLDSRYHDADRARMFADDFKQRVAAGTVPRFSWIFLPNNHTFGVSPGKPTPDSWVADNDEGVGIVVDTIAHSSVWDRSVIFVMEDDAQSGFDHVDKHRCPVLAIGPRVKHGYVSHVHYSMPNVHKTIELILGAPPMTRYDGWATGMYDLFTARADATPFAAIPRLYPETIYHGDNPALNTLSHSMDWDDADEAPRSAELLMRYAEYRRRRPGN